MKLIKLAIDLRPFFNVPATDKRLSDVDMILQSLPSNLVEVNHLEDALTSAVDFIGIDHVRVAGVEVRMPAKASPFPSIIHELCEKTCLIAFRAEMLVYVSSEYSQEHLEKFVDQMNLESVPLIDNCKALVSIIKEKLGDHPLSEHMTDADIWFVGRDNS